MSKKALVGVMLVLLAAQSAVASDKVDDVVAKLIEARGGIEALRAVSSVRVTGTLRIDGSKSPYTLEWKRPNKVRLEYESHGRTSVQAFDGEVGWALSPFAANGGAVELTGSQLDRVKARADYIDGELVDYRKKGNEVKWVGRVEVDGRDAYKLAVKRADGVTGHTYVDAEHYLAVQRERKIPHPAGRIDAVSRMSKYKRVGDLMVAHAVATTMGGPGMQGAHGKKQSNAIEKMELNVEIDDARFTMPKQEVRP